MSHAVVYCLQSLKKVAIVGSMSFEHLWSTFKWIGFSYMNIFECHQVHFFARFQIDKLGFVSTTDPLQQPKKSGNSRKFGKFMEKYQIFRMCAGACSQPQPQPQSQWPPQPQRKPWGQWCSQLGTRGGIFWIILVNCANFLPISNDPFRTSMGALFGKFREIPGNPFGQKMHGRKSWTNLIGF